MGPTLKCSLHPGPGWPASAATGAVCAFATACAGFTTLVPPDSVLGAAHAKLDVGLDRATYASLGTLLLVVPGRPWRVRARLRNQ